VLRFIAAQVAAVPTWQQLRMPWKHALHHSAPHHRTTLLLQPPFQPCRRDKELVTLQKELAKRDKALKAAEKALAAKEGRAAKAEERLKRREEGVQEREV
jgi:hypothetical protein